MNILETIHDRYSYRGKYHSTPVPRVITKSTVCHVELI